MLKRFFSSQRSQAMPEFALVAIPLFVILFGVFDVGRGVIAYVAIQHAANEGGRVIAQGFPDAASSSCSNPCAYTPATTSQITTAVISTTPVVSLQQAPSCPNGPIPSLNSLKGTIAENVGYIYVSDPENPTSTSAGSVSGPNHPLGETLPNNCTDGGSAVKILPLQVTVIYRFHALLPGFLHLPSDIMLEAYSVYETEY